MRSIKVRSAGQVSTGRATAGRTRKAAQQFLHIGLVNNMADGAMGITEHRFLTLLEMAAEDMLVHVTLYALPEVERTPCGQRRVGSFYAGIEQLWSSRRSNIRTG